LSQLNKHEDALVNAMNSVILIQNELLKVALPKLSDQQKEQKMNGLETDADGRKKGSLGERLTILSIAYHNFAVELEYLNKYEQSMRTYEKAYEFSNTYLGPENHVSQNLKKVLDTARETIEQKLHKIKKDDRIAAEVASKKETLKGARKEYQIKNSALATKKNQPTESQKKLRPSAASKTPAAQETTNNLQKPRGADRIENEGMPQRDKKAAHPDYRMDSKRSESKEDGAMNRSGAEGMQNDRGDRDNPAKKNWTGLVSAGGDDSDHQDPDEMGEENDHSVD
jgi:hypothetical protein